MIHLTERKTEKERKREREVRMQILSLMKFWWSGQKCS